MPRKQENACHRLTNAFPAQRRLFILAPGYALGSRYEGPATSGSTERTALLSAGPLTHVPSEAAPLGRQCRRIGGGRPKLITRVRSRLYVLVSQARCLKLAHYRRAYWRRVIAQRNEARTTSSTVPQIIPVAMTIAVGKLIKGPPFRLTYLTAPQSFRFRAAH
jgi:hypothetical protein